MAVEEELVAMSCDLSDITIDFESSGIKLRPLNVDLRQNWGEDDYCSVKVTTEAARHTANRCTDREPVTFQSYGNQIFRGWIKKGGIDVGRTAGWLDIRDPLQILEAGTVDREFIQASLKEIGDHIWDQVYDPEGVLTGHTYLADGSETMYQHDQGSIDISATLGGPALKFEDWLAEKMPLVEGDGRFDYRGETPREAFTELVHEFNTSMFVRSDGEFVIGLPDQSPNVYSAGTHEGNWKLIDYSLPHQQADFGEVIVKGSLPSTFEGPIGDAPSRYMRRMDESVPWAVAKMQGYDGDPTLMEYSKSGDKQVLEDVATRKLVEQFRSYHQGSFEVDVLAAETGPMSMGPLKVGDVVNVEQDLECDIPGGEFRVRGIQHKFGSGEGWKVRFDVVRVVDFSRIITDSWDYDPRDKSLNDQLAEDIWRSILAGATGPIGAAKFGLYQTVRYGRQADVADIPDEVYNTVEDGRNMLEADIEQVMDDAAAAAESAEETADEATDAIEDLFD